MERRRPLHILMILTLATAWSAACKGDDADKPRVRRPTPVMGASTGTATEYRPMRVRPRQVPLPQIEASDEQLVLIQRALRSPNPGIRAEIAMRLQEELGALATAYAIGQSFKYPRYERRQIEATALGESMEELPYTVVLPRDYDPERPWPMHIDLHGGGLGPDHRSCLRHFTMEEVNGFILMCPTTYRGEWWKPPGEAVALRVFEEVKKHFNVDTDRVSIGGLSNGGNGTWHLGHKYPWMWSALVPRCAGKIRQERFVANIMATPVFMIHGAMDSTIGVEHTREVEYYFKRYRKPFYTYYEVPDGGHKYFPDLNVYVLPWLRKQERAIQARFAFEPTRGSDHGIVHWLEVWPQTPLRAHLMTQKTGTTIKIQTDKAPSKVTVYLNDRMADLDKPVLVQVNGQKVFEGKVERSARTALETFHRTYDVHRTFTVALSPPLNTMARP